MNKLKIGDVFYESWGYDQTNIDFVYVVGISPTGKTALCRMMGKQDVANGLVRPTEAFGERFRLKVGTWPTSAEPELKGSYPFVQHEDGRSSKRFGYFTLYTEPVYETPAGMGH